MKNQIRDSKAVLLKNHFGVCSECQQGRIGVVICGKQQEELVDHEFRGKLCPGSRTRPETIYRKDEG